MLDGIIRSVRMTGLVDDATETSTRTARGSDHHAGTGRSGWSPLTMRPRCRLITIQDM